MVWGTHYLPGLPENQDHQAFLVGADFKEAIRVRKAEPNEFVKLVMNGLRNPVSAWAS